MMINQHGGQSEQTRVVDHFVATDLGTPFKVVLHKAVRVTFNDRNEAISYSIPDLDGLLRATVIARILHERKLSGSDIRFVRRAIGVKQKDVARSIEMSPEHLSRCEAGNLVMSPTSEKLLRIFALKTVVKLNRIKACEAKTKLEDALDKLFEVMKPISAHSVEHVLEFHFRRTRPSSDVEGDDADDVGGQWDDGQLAEAA